MERGYIKAINPNRLFGFITPEGSKAPDMFFHARALQGGLEFTEQLKFQRVEFETGERRGRVEATAVWPASN